MTTTMNYPGFRFAASELSAFIFVATVDTFVIALKDNRIVRYMPEDNERFRQWLLDHKIRDIGK